MPNPMPTLGYPSRTAAVLAMRQQGLRPRVIGPKIGLTPKQVTSLSRGADRFPVHFPKEVARMLEPHAKKRGMSVSGLAIAIVFTAAEDGLIDGLLDDVESAR